VFQAQHQGILAVLNVLDDGTGRPVQQQPSSRAHIIHNNTSGVRSDAPAVRHPHPDQSIKTHGSKLPTEDVLTDISLSTLPSDSVVDCSNARPEQKESSANHNEMSHAVDASTEPKQLRSIDGATRFLRLNPAVGESRSQKQGSQPFSSLLEALKQMNGDLGGGQRTAAAAGAEVNPAKPGQFRLLRFPPASTVDEFPVKLPRMIPTPQAVRAFISPVGNVMPATRMPQVNEFPVWHANPVQRNVPDEYLLRLPQSSHGLFLVPPDNTQDDLPFPMLRLIEPNNQRVPFFVPPEHFLKSSRHRAGVKRADSSQLNSPARESPQLLKLDMDSLETKNYATERHR